MNPLRAVLLSILLIPPTANALRFEWNVDPLSTWEHITGTWTGTLDNEGGTSGTFYERGIYLSIGAYGDADEFDQKPERWDFFIMSFIPGGSDTDFILSSVPRSLESGEVYRYVQDDGTHYFIAWAAIEGRVWSGSFEYRRHGPPVPDGGWTLLMLGLGVACVSFQRLRFA